MNYLVPLGLAALCALPVVCAIALWLAFTSGAEPWNKKTYRTVGILHAINAILFAALVAISWAMTKTSENWIGLGISVIFGFISYNYLRKAYKQ